MPYLDQAARQLGMSEKTLRRWLTLVDPPITPTKHRYDLRYHCITDDEVERVRQERALRPGTQDASGTRYGGNLTAQTAIAIRSPKQPPSSRQQALGASFSGTPSGVPLPADGKVFSRSAIATAHNVPLSTLIRWCASGKVEVVDEKIPGEHGQFDIQKPLTRRGLAQFYVLASPRHDFVPCGSCPHDDDHDDDG